MAASIDTGSFKEKCSSVLHQLSVTQRRYLDASVPHRGLRWSLFAMLCLLYLARVVSYGGFFIFTYALFIHFLAQLLLLVTPLYDPEESRAGGAELPTTNARNGDSGDEFRPFVPVVQEFVVWKSMSKGVLICLALTMFPFLDIPVYWPILVVYSVVLLVINMGARIKHMWRHGYVPWNASKPKFVPKNNL